MDLRKVEFLGSDYQILKNFSIQSFNHRPSFLSGMASVMDLSGTSLINGYTVAESDKEADTKALLSDFVSVGNCMRGAMHEFQEKQKKSNQ